MPGDKYQHIFLNDSAQTRDFTPVSARDSGKVIPHREPEQHSQFLTRKFNESWQMAENEQAVIKRTRSGVYIEFKSDPGAELVTKSLEDMRSKKVRLLNIRTKQEEDGEVIYATVYVSNDKKRHFLDKIEAYALTANNDTQKNANLVNSISDLRKALLVESFWIDSREYMPSDEKVWCEVWLSSDNPDVLREFEELLLDEEIEASSGFIRFPERIVKLIFASKRDLETITQLSDYIAEYRRAKETASFWLEMQNRQQAEWVEDLLNRLEVEADPSVAVCILDTGVNNGHPLLLPILQSQDCLTVDPTWGIDDHHKHGTLMAGIAAYGDLKKHLASREAVTIFHCLESVKIVPRPPMENRQELWGYVTAQAISRAEVQAPQRNRLLCLAVAATDSRDQGRPSSWSGQLDKLASGADDDMKRLIIVCAGNMTNREILLDYPNAQLTDSIHDPAQAWNAITVGAYTVLDEVTDPSLNGFMPLAQAGQLSPFTTTSIMWDYKWPNKPDIVMEGGNLAHDGQGFYDESDDLCLLSTFYNPTISHFGSHNMTSAATAQAAWLAAQIQHFYPESWPETIRALMIHSAEWPDAIKNQFLADELKSSYTELLRICGYGVPNLDRALYSAGNSLTLISQAEIQPYEKKTNSSGYRTKEMHLYELPWPKEVLQDLPPEIEVRMRVTLSYFIEPGPGEIGWKDRYRYASHALRFDVKSPSEETEEFVRRINVASRTEEEGHPGTQSASDHWVIGSKGRDRGSIHSDIWKGSAAELAASGVIVVYPIIGWWRERPHLGKFDSRARYSLIVSISTPSEEVDIYTPVANIVGITLPIAVEV